MKLNKVCQLALYLILKHRIYSKLRINKIIFFIRVYEKINKKDFGIFKPNWNFEAWIYGPVPPTVYEFCDRFLSREYYELYDIEIENKWVKNFKQFEIFDDLIDLLQRPNIDYDGYENGYKFNLALESKTNKEYQHVRKGVKDMEPCSRFLDENSKLFVEFNHLFSDDIKKAFKNE